MSKQSRLPSRTAVQSFCFPSYFLPLMEKRLSHTHTHTHTHTHLINIFLISRVQSMYCDITHEYKSGEEIRRAYFRKHKIPILPSH